ncbi:SNO1 [Candida oxycetoniae]|uniref:glutaminase n=1 Tax=Candida oxycetoniae TaxID=497107 RepID=A0AAI9SVY5_9ASCO|nr:SNO1 [Candida oxycetoniae]KAI3403844.2 SNO1 [Candida oxycetoniae]
MTQSIAITIGVLALQGAFQEHLTYLETVISQDEEKYSNYSFRIIPVKTKEVLFECSALVIPGGESSSMSYIAERTGLLPHLYEFVADESKAIWGTCAGLIFLSKQIRNGLKDQKCLGGLNIETNRNAFGRQLDSFVKELDFSKFISGCTDFLTVFIRAPVVTKVLTEPNSSRDLDKFIKSENDYVNEAPVEVLYSLDNYDGDNNKLMVAVRQGRILGTSFHPELSDDHRFHQWFIDEFVLHI